MTSISEKLSIVAIGGGSPAQSIEHLKFGLDLTGLETYPHVLLIPTAKTTQQDHTESVEKARQVFGGQLRLPVELLHDFDEMPATSELEEKLAWADIVYINGGDTDQMMDIWKIHGVDTLIRVRALGGMVISGISAGAIAPFARGYSDSMQYKVPEGEDWYFTDVDGLGLINAAITPHANTTHEGRERGDDFIGKFIDEAATSRQNYGFAIDNRAALIVSEGLIYAKPLEDRFVRVAETVNYQPFVHRMNLGDSVPLTFLTE